MALTSPKMGLRIWDQLSDPYDHDQLADNWSKVDFHDHTPGRGVQIPTEGLADGAVTSAKLAASVDPTPVYATYKVVAPPRTGYISAGSVAGTYALGSAQQGVILGTSATLRAFAFYINPSDHAVSGRTTYYRLRSSLFTNATAPAINFTTFVAQVSGIGGAAAQEPYISNLYASNATIVFTTPAANAILVSTSSDFTISVAGWYIMGVTTSGNLAATNPIISIANELHMRQV